MKEKENKVATKTSNNNNARVSGKCVCCLGPACNSSLDHSRDFSKMVLDEVTVVCEGSIEKKILRKRITFGNPWKKKYCVLNSEAIILYGNKRKKVNNSAPSRTIPFCHIKSVTRVYEDNLNKLSYFNVFTQQNETFSFRCEQDKAWEAQIQIQLIQYKVRVCKLPTL